MHGELSSMAMKSEKTTIERPIPRTDPNEEENIPYLIEERERRDVPSNSRIKGRDALPGQSNKTRDARWLYARKPEMRGHHHALGCVLQRKLVLKEIFYN
ncbi:hypothetical protein HAX54_027615 [Datura stramonium]|uniref:Uncharacterized protein n=1 Tax=Datura stramonium TaxID=4076 RepID=A0ABS8S8W8_DATST|nr:hypothetical protein [Datura stramonium]